MARKAKRRAIPFDYIFDIETENWETFVIGVVYDCKANQWTVYTYEQEEAFARHLLALVGNLWAFNGGRYDGLWLMRWIRKFRLDGTLTDEPEIYATSARITCLKIGKLNVRDMVALIPMRLADAAKLAGHRKSDTGLECECGKECGGYCAIRRDMDPTKRQRLIDYCINDCKVGAAIGDAITMYAEENDLDIRGTIGSTSWSTAKRRYKLPTAKWTNRHYVMARRGYYGGRTQVFKPRSRKGWRYDINSAYPAALKETALPVGPLTELAGQDAMEAWLSGKPGVYQARVRVPDMHLPPLPLRIAEDKTGRVRYPIGEFSGVWCANELTYAVTCGVEVLAMGLSLVWDRSEYVLRDFAEWGWSLRAKVGKDAAFGKWVKWFLNSLTGKLAQRPSIDKCFIPSKPPAPCKGGSHCKGSLCGTPGIGCCDHRCVRACGSARPLGKDRIVWTVREYKMPDNGHVVWAGYLTAAARIKWHRMASSIPAWAIVYCDTDCLFAEVECTENIGEDLGQWLPEGVYVDFHALAPKTYSYIDDAKVGYRLPFRIGDEPYKRVVRAKGIPSAVWDDLVNRRTIRIEKGVEQFRTGARKGDFFRRKVLTRRLKYDGIHYGDRVLGDDGLTHPQTVHDVRRNDRAGTQASSLESIGHSESAITRKAN